MANTEKVTCYRCQGAGSLPQFSHNYGGQCFLCKGSGKVRPRRPAIAATFATVAPEWDDTQEIPGWMTGE